MINSFFKGKKILKFLKNQKNLISIVSPVNNKIFSKVITVEKINKCENTTRVCLARTIIILSYSVRIVDPQAAEYSELATNHKFLCLKRA